MDSLFRRVMVALPLVVAASAACADVTVATPWVRGVVAGQSTTGAFMTISSTTATRLVKVASPAAAETSVHQTSMVDGMMRMEPVESLAVPAHGSVELKPGGFHVMLMGLRAPLRTGQTVPLTLTFRGADGHDSTVTVQAQVRDVTGAAAGGKP